MTRAIETDVFEGLIFAERVNPKRKNSLVSFPELSSTSKNTASVDPYWEVKAFSVLKDQGFRSEF
jgi:hypothetical protein